MSLNPTNHEYSLNVSKNIFSDAIEFSKNPTVIVGGISALVTSIAIGLLLGSEASLNFGFGTIFGLGLRSITITNNPKINKILINQYSSDENKVFTHEKIEQEANQLIHEIQLRQRKIDKLLGVLGVKNKSKVITKNEDELFKTQSHNTIHTPIFKFQQLHQEVDQNTSELIKEIQTRFPRVGKFTEIKDKDILSDTNGLTKEPSHVFNDNSKTMKQNIQIEQETYELIHEIQQKFPEIDKFTGLKHKSRDAIDDFNEFDKKQSCKEDSKIKANIAEVEQETYELIQEIQQKFPEIDKFAEI